MRPARIPPSLALLLTFLLLSVAHKGAAAPASTDCEGDACAQVSVAFDEARQQYHAQNNSADRWARVTASNLAASSSACLGPGKDAYLTLKSISGAYRAEFAEPRCGEQGPDGAPPSQE
jgi:hypothetical protein